VGEPVASLRRILPLITALLAAAVIYDGSIFYSRWSRKRDLERAQIREEAEQARKTLEMLGGNELRITKFYASPGVIRPGGQATICYGVNGAKKVRIEPPVEEVWPALSRCLQVTPRKDTEYKLIAEGAAGRSVSQSFVLKVAP
jgi:hypothetical protein